MSLTGTSLIPFGHCPSSEIPFSVRTSAVSGRMCPSGRDPALEARTLPRPRWFASASAIWLRQELPMQTKRTLMGWDGSPGIASLSVHQFFSSEFLPEPLQAEQLGLQSIDDLNDSVAQFLQKVAMNRLVFREFGMERGREQLPLLDQDGQALR